MNVLIFIQPVDILKTDNFLILSNIKVPHQVNIQFELQLGEKEKSWSFWKSHELGLNLEISEDRLKELLLFKQWNGRLLMLE